MDTRVSERRENQRLKAFKIKFWRGLEQKKTDVIVSKIEDTESKCFRNTNP